MAYRSSTSVISPARKSVARRNLLARRAIATRLVDWSRWRSGTVKERPGVTVVTVTWNSVDYLRGCIEAVRRFSDPSVEMLVVDNHSTDGTSQYLADRRDLRTVRTPFNFGHGPALDLAFALAETEKVVVLDVDAFPISPDWLSVALDPLEEGAIISGAYVQRAFIHPSFLAMRRCDYLRFGIPFAPVGVAVAPGGVPHGLFMDVGEALSHMVAVVAGSSALHRIPITADSGDHLVGSIYGDVVYHGFYSTQGDPRLVTATQRAWSEALARYLN